MSNLCFVRKTTLSSPDRDSDLNLPVLSSRARHDKRVSQLRHRGGSRGSNEFSLQPLDPMHIPEMQVVYQMGDNIKGNVTVINSDTYALSKIRINDVRSNVNDTHLYMEVDVKFPGVFIEGSYKANGLIVVFPINGKGVFNISMSDVSATWKLSGQVIKRNEVDYLRLDHFNMRPVVGDMKFYASELFTGSDELNAAALTFANQFWPIVYEALLPFADEGWDQVMTDAANKIFLKVPFKELFPNGPL
uniref:Uncharacterized protein n=1 Tax=Timema shepardi TaxID=629360 RepID=A0A7R9AYI5_TIMSH|nr:unnamed protein product [Timema shepardi]